MHSKIVLGRNRRDVCVEMALNREKDTVNIGSSYRLIAFRGFLRTYHSENRFGRLKNRVGVDKIWRR
jgi:hypothetical protein